jgi:hypothetical protein
MTLHEKANNTHITYKLTDTQSKKVYSKMNVSNAIGLAMPVHPDQEAPYLIDTDLMVHDITMQQAFSI